MEQFIRTLGGTNFRKGPGTSHPIIRWLPGNTIVQVLPDDDEGDTWYNARLEDGTEGYITSLTRYVQPFEPAWLTQAKKVIDLIEFYRTRVNADGTTNTKYEFGSARTNDKTFDCSDLMQWCYKKTIDIQLAWDSRAQSKFGTDVPLNYKMLRTGDLLFFDTNGDDIVNHVGMYVYPNLLLHTSNPQTNIRWTSIYPGSWYDLRATNARRVIEG